MGLIQKGAEEQKIGGETPGMNPPIRTIDPWSLLHQPSQTSALMLGHFMLIEEKLIFKTLKSLTKETPLSSLLLKEAYKS